MHEQLLSHGASQVAVRHLWVGWSTCLITMTGRVDQWLCIKFCFKLGHSSTETIGMIKKAFADDSMSEAQIKLWYQCFKDGWESLDSYPCSGRPSTIRTPQNVECMPATISEKWWLTVWELEEDLGIPQTCFRDFDGVSWQETCGRESLLHSSCHKSRRNFILKLHRTCLNL